MLVDFSPDVLLGSLSLSNGSLILVLSVQSVKLLLVFRSHLLDVLSSDLGNEVVLVL